MIVNLVLFLFNFFTPFLGIDQKKTEGRSGNVNGKYHQRFYSKDIKASARSPRKYHVLIFSGQFFSRHVCKGLPSRPTRASQVLTTPSSLLQVFWVTPKYTNKQKRRPLEMFWISSSCSLNYTQISPEPLLCARHWVTKQSTHIRAEGARGRESVAFSRTHTEASTECGPFLSASLQFKMFKQSWK